MIIRLAALWLLAAAVSLGEIDLPRIGCWIEPASGEARVLYGIAGTLAVRPAPDGEGCANHAGFSEPGEDGVRTLPIAAKWQLAETAEGERYLIYKAATRYELPQ